MSKVAAAVRGFFRKEPAVALGAAAAVLLDVQSAVEGVDRWEAAVPLVLAFLIRRFVTPAR